MTYNVFSGTLNRTHFTSRSLSFWSSENWTFLDLSPPFWRGPRNWWLIMIIWDLAYSLSEPNFWVFFSVKYHVTSNFVESRYYRLSNGHISLLLEARVTWSGMLAVIVHADVTLTRSKVTGPVHPSERTKVRSISSAISVCSSKLMVDYDSMVWDLVYRLSEPDFRFTPK